MNQKIAHILHNTIQAATHQYRYRLTNNRMIRHSAAPTDNTSNINVQSAALSSSLSSVHTNDNEYDENENENELLMIDIDDDTTNNKRSHNSDNEEWKGEMEERTRSSRHAISRRKSIMTTLCAIVAILSAIGATTTYIFTVIDNDGRRDHQQQQTQFSTTAMIRSRSSRKLQLNQHQFGTATIHQKSSSSSKATIHQKSSSSSTTTTKKIATATATKVDGNSNIENEDEQGHEKEQKQKQEQELQQIEHKQLHKYRETTYHYTNPKPIDNGDATISPPNYFLRSSSESEASTSTSKSESESSGNSKNKNQHELFDPSIAWLASFPNSGTSFTMTLVARATNTTFATNYGLEANYGARDTPSLPIYDRHPEGPFMPNPTTSFHHRHLPYGKYVMTKTHCGGYCVNCQPSEYVYGYPKEENTNTNTNTKSAAADTDTNTDTAAVLPSPSSLLQQGQGPTVATTATTTSIVPAPLLFLQDCASGHAIDHKGHLIDVAYPPERVARVIHLIRNPLHNVIARFHLERKHHHDANTTLDEKWLVEHPDNGVGMSAFCHELDQQRWEEETTFFLSDYFLTKKNKEREEEESSSETDFTRRNGGGEHRVDATTPGSPVTSSLLLSSLSTTPSTTNTNSNTTTSTTTTTKSRTIEEEWKEIIQNVPCRGDFFRYVQWHNLLHQSLDYLPYKLPVLTVYYEDYQPEEERREDPAEDEESQQSQSQQESSQFMTTAVSILDFLHLTAVPGDKRGNIKWATFESRSDYDEYFTPTQKHYITKFITILSSYQVWGELQHYFEE